MGISDNSIFQYHVSFNEVQITVHGIPGEKILYTVPLGRNVRVTELTVRGTEVSIAFIVQLQVSGGAVKLSFDGIENDSREWESEVGRIFTAGQGIGIKAYGVYGTTVYGSLGGPTLYISGSGYEWTI